MTVMQVVPVWEDVGARVRALFDTVGRGALDLFFAALVFAAGLALARLISTLLRSLLRAMRFNEAAHGLLGGTPSRYEPAALVSWAVHWTVVLIASLLAGDLLGFELTFAVGERLRDLLPRVLAAAIVLVVGIALAMAFGALARRLFESAGFRGSVLRGRVVSVVLSAFAVLLALEQLGLAAQLILALSVTAIASVGLAAALAFGLGCRELARDFVVEMLRSMDEGGTRPPPP